MERVKFSDLIPECTVDGRRWWKIGDRSRSHLGAMAMALMPADGDYLIAVEGHRLVAWTLFERDGVLYTHGERKFLSQEATRPRRPGRAPDDEGD